MAVAASSTKTLPKPSSPLSEHTHTPCSKSLDLSIYIAPNSTKLSVLESFEAAKMPLGERSGDKSESRYCGVETDFNDDMPHVLHFNLYTGSFDFVVAPLVRFLHPFFDALQCLSSQISEVKSLVKIVVFVFCVLFML